MFFNYRIYDKTDKKLYVTKTTECATEDLSYSDCIKSMLSSAVCVGEGISRIEWHLGITASVRHRIGDAYLKSEDGYAITVDTVTKVYASTERGLIYAAATLSQLSRADELFRGFIYDVPMGEERGYRVFLPSHTGMQEFYRMVDFLATYKFNAIIIEIGGAMEYRRHPEINSVWAEFCRDAFRFSKRTHEIQFKTYPWPKNSIHCDNAEGDIITQDECRQIAAYCRSRGLRVIPECPSLSHCDFLCIAHPDLREREGDGHPDTYCPRHPDVYTYVFDILEEVIDVFEPDAINIGHDETYSIGICPRCKDTPAYVLYAEDTKKIYEFLKARGIRTYMWAEKLLKARSGKYLIGGAGHGKGSQHVPALWPCRDLLPRDITYLHWYWPFNEDYDNVYHERGMRVLFGNMNALAIKNYKKRVSRGIRGGFVSNWGFFSNEYMQRNLQYLNLLSAAYAFWCDDFEARGKESMLKLCFEEGYRYAVSRVTHPIEITHTTSHSIPFEWVWNGIFITDEKYLLGNYELTYKDGSVAYLPVRYGSHIGCANIKKTVGNTEFTQLVYGVLPVNYSGHYAYRTVYEDPHPEKAISSVKYVPADNFKDISFEMIGFSRAIQSHITATVVPSADTAFDADIAGLQE